MGSKRCVYCASLTIEKLVHLAEREFYGHTFPGEHYYQHHQSFKDLESAAYEGCDLCWVILDAFKTTPEDYMSSAIGITAEEADRRGSLYTEAILAEPSHVRLAINASHVYAGRRLDEVEAFDILLVQTDQPLFIDGRRIGRFETGRDLGADENFAVVNAWLQQCREEHLTCRTEVAGLLPTRVIDVHSEPPKLVLSRGAVGKYLALSHCWGGAISVLLTTKTIDPFQEELPMDQIPRNFEDAITITRRLGVQYLWIDSLCIMQDCKEDWTVESKKMGQVYRDSVLTIYAAAATGSTSGILCKGSNNGSQARAAIKVFNNELLEVAVAGKWDPDLESMKVLERSSPLNKRGWTLQELTLSPRQLHFGKDGIYWRCREQTCSLDGLSIGNLSPYDSMDVDPSSVFFWDTAHGQRLTPDEMQVAMTAFLTLVQTYSHRALTYNTDKLPALSGLCERIHRLIGGEYLAGIWSRDLARGLLWYKEMSSCKHVQPYRAPSWSWATTNDPVLFQIRPEMPATPSIEIISHRIEPCDSANPYGAVRSGLLVVKGLTLPLIRSRQVDKTLWSQDRYTALFIDTGTDLKSAMGLVLRPKEHSADVTFERVGMFSVDAGVVPGLMDELKDETITLV
ncbi:hypothetical protein M409DRAFT_64912 [Zasmidium cellare ATCC 36951]|uniref:Heterokaryon incompatibility domain-containing protein n=1 Tax=Zasmidium cellare ATCC 36951 TaxID=1080233 RepID=A0A6A6CSI7_ZASCE|nr:uncharacterized protein M409DRAFT_64912 [Zasmidium cellare ATCC 36951]KAF2169148.1 hypothetical protein M409DRAFT_64912 [Zasmidium cellare ATCC 36951]